MERPVAWNTYDESALNALEALSRRYRDYLNAGKTERECVTRTIEIARGAGYVSLEDRIRSGEKLRAGERIYSAVMGKAIMLFHIGESPLEKGVNIVGAHIDSPRIDIKQNPFYESEGLAYADTHYYGGIKKYQWVARALALHGVVVKKDGTVIHLTIGEDENDPVVGVSDLLIHLAQDQMAKKASEVIGGEDLDIILCGRPLAGEEKEPVKAALLKILKDKYDIDEEDMLSAEIEAVPAGKCREFGLDRSMILGYGHDDRVCAYASIEAILSLTDVPKHTSCCLLVDKEEIGSVGATGMRARYFENAMAELMELAGESGDLRLRRALAASRMLSCDSRPWRVLQQIHRLARQIRLERRERRIPRQAPPHHGRQFRFLADRGARQGRRRRRRNDRVYLRALRHGGHRQRRRGALDARAGGNHQQGRPL